MKTRQLGMLVAMISMSLAQGALADELRLGEPGYAGSGCPAGSVSAVLSPDQKTLSVLFDSYVAEAGGSSGNTIDRKNCTLAIPVHVPQGFSVSLYKVDYRGYTYVPRGANAQFNVEYFFAGYRGPRGQRSFNGPVDSEYLISNDIAVGALVWSPCGADTNLRINSAMTARTNARREQVMATVDSTDVRSSMLYHIAWQRCR